MKNFKAIAAVLVLIVVLGTTGGQILASPCPLPEPGQTDTPPCTSTQLVTEDITVSKQLETSSASDAFDSASAIGEAAIAFLLF